MSEYIRFAMHIEFKEGMTDLASNCTIRTFEPYKELEKHDDISITS